jgi:hypothetical protein
VSRLTALFQFFPFLWNFLLQTETSAQVYRCHYQRSVAFSSSLAHHFLISFFTNSVLIVKIILKFILEFNSKFLKPPRLDCSQDSPDKPSHCKISILNMQIACKFQLTIPFDVVGLNNCIKNDKNFH